MMLIDVALAVLALAFALALGRALIGPTVADRALAADVGLYAVIAGVALLALRSGSEAFIDVVLIATLLSFLATAALGALISRIQS